MGLWRGVKKGLGKVFNFQVDRWLDYPNLKGSAVYFYRQLKSLYKFETASRTETYEDAVARLKLSAEDLNIQRNHFEFFARIFFVLFLSILGYGLWISVNGNWMGGIMSLALAIYALTNAFRYDLWKYQIQQKKLGCSLKEWFYYRFACFSNRKGMVK